MKDSSVSCVRFIQSMRGNWLSECAKKQIFQKWKFILRFPVLKIHCWGGLGSQLFALSYYGIIKNTYPNRYVQLVLHTGGVTERKSEIDFLYNKLDMISVYDYQYNDIKENTNNISVLGVRHKCKKLIKTFLNSIRLVITNEHDVQKIRPWTSNVRCSYSNLELNRKIIVELGSLLQLDGKTINSNFIGIHLRIGDLVTFKPEGIVNSGILSNLISDLNQTNETAKKVIVYSDTELELNFLNLTAGYDIELRNIDTLHTIVELTTASSFIGTNSKVSLWIAFFRYGLKIPGKVFLPNSNYDLFHKVIKPFQPFEDFKVKSYTT